MATTTLVLGAGFGGIAAANTLRRLMPAEDRVIVLDREARFHVGAGKTWLMLGERTFAQISQSRPALLEPGIQFHETAVQQLDVAGRRVITAQGPMPWDYLVIALGADLNLNGVPGLAEAAHTFYTVAGAERLRPVLADFSRGDLLILIPKAPFKCPPAPYEAAMLLQDHFRRQKKIPGIRLDIHTVEGTPMATAGPEMGAFIREELQRRGIGFFPQRHVTRVNGADRTVEFADGSSARYDLLVCIPPHEAPAVTRDAGLLNAAGWIAVDPHSMEAKAPGTDGRVFAIGDVTSVPLPGRFKPDLALSLPKAGVMAQAQGEVAARQIAARILGTTSDASFDGRGACYLETGGGQAVKAEGSFFALPHPVMEKKPPSEEQMRDKLAWVAELLTPRR